MPADLGVTPARLRADLLTARQIRRRYTILDLAAETDLLEPCIDGLIQQLAADASEREAVPCHPERAKDLTT